MNIKKYINNITGLQFYQLLRFGILFLISIIFTKSYFGNNAPLISTSEIGVYETFLLIAGSVSFFWISGIIQSLLSLFNNSNSFTQNNDKNPIIFNTFLLLILFSCTAGGLVYIFQGNITELLNLSNSQLPYHNILVAYIIFSGPSNLIEYIYFLKNKTKSIFIYGIISLSIQLFAVIIPIIYTRDLGYGLYGLLGTNVLKFLWLTILIKKHSQIKISKPFLKEHINVGYPLVLSLLIGGSGQYVDGILVSNKFDESTFAIFRYGARELPFVILLANTFSNGMVTVFGKLETLKADCLELKSRSLKLTHLLFPITIILLISSKYLYPILFNENFIESAEIFNIYLLLIISRLVFPQTILIGHKKSKTILIASIFELAINISLSIILINYMGIVGVAWATVIAFAFEKLFLIIAVKIQMKINFSEYTPVKYLLLYSAITCLVFLLT